jgi:hypothetical protein
MRDSVTWLLWIPAPSDWVEPRARTLWTAQYGPASDEVVPWELLPDGQDGTLLVDREPGSEGTDEEAAIAFSREQEQPVYLLRLTEGAEVVWRFEQGRRSGTESDDARAWASRHGLRIPD